jgi:hypothetical protein
MPMHGRSSSSSAPFSIAWLTRCCSEKHCKATTSSASSPARHRSKDRCRSRRRGPPPSGAYPPPRCRGSCQALP